MKLTSEQLRDKLRDNPALAKLNPDLAGAASRPQPQQVKLTGATSDYRPWTADEEAAIVRYYDSGGIELDAIAAALGRTKAAVACKANELNVTFDRGTAPKMPAARASMSRAQKARKNTPDERAETSRFFKGWFQDNPHPKGMSGKHHCEETKGKISKALKGCLVPPERTLRQLKSRLAKYGTLSTYRKTSWKQGWREIGGKRIYARSMWEANYARYLEFLKTNKEIFEWEHEPETFWFEKVKRGCRSYLPDFRVTGLSGSVEFHEVKGWMDQRSKTKIKRMRIYHPSVKLVVICGDWFKKNARTLRGVVSGWEVKSKKEEHTEIVIERLT